MILGKLEVRCAKGDIVSFPDPPTRWEQFLHWAIKRPLPKRRSFYRIIATTDEG